MERPSVGALGTILGVWAHPDDETYLSAGLMARAVRSGCRVVCVTATRGEEGTWDPERWPPSELGKIREAELEASMRILGVDDHRWLDYHDGACDRVPLEEGVAKVVALIEELQPDSVLTFGPEGMTDHPDHKAVSRWTTDAFHHAAKPGARLYYATQTPEWAEEWVPKLNRFNVFYSPDVPPLAEPDDCAIYFELPEDMLALKLEAISQHVSQVEGMMNAFGADIFARAMNFEAYTLGVEKDVSPPTSRAMR